MMYPIFPSLLAFDFTCLKGQVASVAAAGAAGLHFDIMDGHFVPNLSFGPLVIKALRPLCDVPFYAHLMVSNPETLIQPMKATGANRLYVHPESTMQIHRLLASIHTAGLEAGVAINPGTPISALEPLLPLVEGVLVMSVDPGFGGQEFLPATYRRLEQLRGLLDELRVSPSVEVDGGVDADNIARLAQLGMTGAVIGSALFHDGNPGEALRRLQQAVSR